MIQPRCKGKNVPDGLFEHIHCRAALFGRRPAELVFQHRTELTLPGPVVPQPFGSVYQNFSRLACQAQHLLRLHFKSVPGVILHFVIPGRFLAEYYKTSSRYLNIPQMRDMGQFVSQMPKYRDSP